MNTVETKYLEVAKWVDRKHHYMILKLKMFYFLNKTFRIFKNIFSVWLFHKMIYFK